MGRLRSAAGAGAGLPIENLAERLRSVDLELERLMADRWPVVLDAFGLVAALEDLAERIEADGAVRIQWVEPKCGNEPVPSAAQLTAVAAQIQRLWLQGAIEFVSGVTDERIVELYAEAEIAVELAAPAQYELRHPEMI